MFLKVKKGEVVGIGGLAGQGQAELLQALYGIYPVTGEIYFQGKKIHIKNPKDAINKKLHWFQRKEQYKDYFFN